MEMENGKIKRDWKCPNGDSGNISTANNPSVRNMELRSQMVAVLRNMDQSAYR